MKLSSKRLGLILASLFALIAIFFGVSVLAPQTRTINFELELFTAQTPNYISPNTNGGTVQILCENQVIEPTFTEKNKQIYALNASKTYTFKATAHNKFGFAGMYAENEFNTNTFRTNEAVFNLNAYFPCETQTDDLKLFAKFGRLQECTLNIQTDLSGTQSPLTLNLPLSLTITQTDIKQIISQNFSEEVSETYSSPGKIAGILGSSGEQQDSQTFTGQQTLTVYPSQIDAVGANYLLTLNANGGSVSESHRTITSSQTYNKLVNLYPSNSTSYFNVLDNVSLSNNVFSAYARNTSSTENNYSYVDYYVNAGNIPIYSGTSYTYVLEVLTWSSTTAMQFHVGNTGSATSNKLAQLSGAVASVSGTGKWFLTMNPTGYSVNLATRCYIGVPYNNTCNCTFRVSLFVGNVTSSVFSYVSPGSCITSPLPTPTKSGYSFDGWYKETSFTNKVTDSTTVTASNHTLYAKWVQNPNLVTFNANGGTVSESHRAIKTGQTYNKLVNVYPSNSTSYFSYLNCVTLSNNVFTAYLKNTTSSIAYANYYVMPYNIPIHSGAKYTYVLEVLTWSSTCAIGLSIGATGSGENYDGVQLSYGSADISGTGKWFVTLTPKSSTNVFATRCHFNIPSGQTLSCTFRVSLFIGNVTSSTFSYVAPESSVTCPLPTPTRTGYTFAGWYKESSFTNKVTDSTTVTASNHTLYAKWTAHTYTIAYNGNGATGGSTANSSHAYGTAKALTSNGFTKTGYNFVGWGESASATSAKYTNAQSVLNLTSTNGATITLYAVWKPNTYTVVYNANGGLGSMSNSSHTYDSAKALNANAFTKQGYIFLGWSTNQNATSATYTNQQSVKNLTTANNGTVTLYAVWGYAYMIEYNGNGGIGNTPASIHTFNQPSNLTANGFTKTGYTFLGWSRSSGATSATYENCQEVNNLASTQYATVMLYAVWQGNPYTVHYDANGGSGSMENSSHVYGTESELSVCTFTKEGYIFLGWSKFSTDTVETYDNRAVVTNLTTEAGATVTLYAIWLKKDITVTVDPNGGVYNGVETATVYNCSVGSDLVLGVPSRPGYEFTEFNTQGDGLGQTLNGTMVLNGDVTFYALWQPLNYVIKYYDGDLYLGQTEAWYNENLSLPRWETLLSNNSLSGGKFTEYGWNFAGWTADANGSEIQHTNGGAVMNLAEAGTTINLYAMHTQTLNLTYNGNGSTSGELANQNTDILLNSASEKITDFVIKLASNSYAKTNYTFKNWAIGSTSGTQKSAGANITNVDLNLTYSSTFNITIYAIWQGNSYTINYYNGTEKIATENYVYGNSATLKTFSTIGEVLNLAYGWEFYGWATVNNTFTRVFEDAQDITNISVENGAEITQNMVIDLYSIYSREVSFVSGLNKASTTTATQFWNPYSINNSNLSSVLAEAPQTIETGNWTALGYRTDLAAGTATFALTTTTEIRPAVNTFNTLYAVYSRTITITDLNTTTTATQYYNSAGTVSTVNAD